MTRISRVASQLSQRLLGILGVTFGTTINTVIVLVLAVFFLLGRVNHGRACPLVAGPWRDLVVSTINRTFRGYFAGQVLLALILSMGQIVVFTVLGIPYGVLFAVLIGHHLDPHASALTIVAVSALLAVQDPSTGLKPLWQPLLWAKSWIR